MYEPVFWSLVKETECYIQLNKFVWRFKKQKQKMKLHFIKIILLLRSRKNFCRADIFFRFNFTETVLLKVGKKLVSTVLNTRKKKAH